MSIFKKYTPKEKREQKKEKDSGYGEAEIESGRAEIKFKLNNRELSSVVRGGFIRTCRKCGHKMVDEVGVIRCLPKCEKCGSSMWT